MFVPVSPSGTADVFLSRSLLLKLTFRKKTHMKLHVHLMRVTEFKPLYMNSCEVEKKEGFKARN